MQYDYDAAGKPHEVFKPHRLTPSLDGLDFIRTGHADDYAMIKFLREHGPQSGAILEADKSPHQEDGRTVMWSSYTYAERISMSTGWPTVLGWHWHELLWRNGFKDFQEVMNEREQDIEEIYTGKDARSGTAEKRTEGQIKGRTEDLLRKYDVRYIIVGGQERSAFPGLNEANLMAVGHVVCRVSDESYIVEVNRNE
jgi:uncharacterized membrane protein